MVQKLVSYSKKDELLGEELKKYNYDEEYINLMNELMFSIKFCNADPQFILNHIKGYTWAINTVFNNLGGTRAIYLIENIREESLDFGLIFKEFW